MSNDIIVALISVAGAIITAAITVYVACLNSYSNNVTKERAKWLQCFREEINILFKGIDASRLSSVHSELEQKAIVDAYGARAAIYSRLRSYPLEGNEYNKQVKDILKSLNFNSDENVDDILRLKYYLNKILEREWDKTKEESSMFFKKGSIFSLIIIWILWGFIVFPLMFCKVIPCNPEPRIFIYVVWFVGLIALIFGVHLHQLHKKRNEIIDECLNHALEKFDKLRDEKIDTDSVTITVRTCRHHLFFAKGNIVVSVNQNDERPNNDKDMKEIISCSIEINKKRSK